MKRFSIILLIVSFAISANCQTWINRTDNKSFSFKAPSGISSNYVALFPAAETQSVAPADTIAFTLKQFYSFVNVNDTLIGSSVVINATLNSQLTKGAQLQLTFITGDSARTIVFGTGFTAESTIIPKSKVKTLLFTYNGSKYIPDCEPMLPVADIQSKTPGATIAVTVSRQNTFVSVADTMTASTTINLTIGSGVAAGAILQVSAKSGVIARTITWGTGLSSPTTTGTQNKTKAATFVYNGTKFIPTGAPQQID
jgi:hypothetical protein